jgi:Fe2+ or Zn2+ uptake regulation protein
MNNLFIHAQEKLHTQGGRMTVQRRLIITTLEKMTGHPTAEDIYAIVHDCDPTINLSTVYRTLRWLEDEYLVHGRVFEDDHRHEHFDPGEPQEHYHFLCLHCKQVIEFDSDLVETLKKQFEARSHAQVHTGSVVLYGLCDPCQLKNQ